MASEAFVGGRSHWTQWRPLESAYEQQHLLSWHSYIELSVGTCCSAVSVLAAELVRFIASELVVDLYFISAYVWFSCSNLRTRVVGLVSCGSSVVVNVDSCYPSSSSSNAAT